MEHEPKETENLHARLNSLPEEHQTIIASYSSFFLEPDVFESYKSDPAKIGAFKGQLRELGLDDEGIDVAMKTIGFTESPQVADNT